MVRFWSQWVSGFIVVVMATSCKPVQFISETNALMISPRAEIVSVSINVYPHQAEKNDSESEDTTNTGDSYYYTDAVRYCAEVEAIWKLNGFDSQRAREKIRENIDIICDTTYSLHRLGELRLEENHNDLRLHRFDFEQLVSANFQGASNLPSLYLDEGCKVDLLVRVLSGVNSKQYDAHLRYVADGEGRVVNVEKVNVFKSTTEIKGAVNVKHL